MTKREASWVGAEFQIGTLVETVDDALIPNSSGVIVGLADDDYPGTTEYFIVDFGDFGTCTVHRDEMILALSF